MPFRYIREKRFQKIELSIFRDRKMSLDSSCNYTEWIIGFRNQFALTFRRYVVGTALRIAKDLPKVEITM
jgi:hypothetical protein